MWMRGPAGSIGRPEGAAGPRTCSFWGCRGSYLRGQATEQSDLNIMCALERVDIGQPGGRIPAGPGAMPDQESRPAALSAAGRTWRTGPATSCSPWREGPAPLWTASPLLPVLHPAGHPPQRRHRRGQPLSPKSCHRYLYGAQGVEGLRGATKAAFLW